jgi:hypothetical protein
MSKRGVTLLSSSTTNPASMAALSFYFPGMFECWHFANMILLFLFLVFPLPHRIQYQQILFLGELFSMPSGDAPALRDFELIEK